MKNFFFFILLILISISFSFDCQVDYPEAIVCQVWKTQEEVESMWLVNNNCAAQPKFDKISNGARLGVGSNCYANSGGSFSFSFDTITEPVWFQFRYKMSESFRVDPPKYNMPSPKIFVSWYGGPSCATEEFTQTNGYFRGYPQWYEACGATGLSYGIGQWDYNLQPGGSTICRYHPEDAEPDEYCWKYNQEGKDGKFIEQWSTYTYYLNFPKMWVTGWSQNDGGERVMILNYSLTHTGKINNFYLSNYMTGKDETVIHPINWYTWYQDIYLGYIEPINFGKDEANRFPAYYIYVVTFGTIGMVSCVGCVFLGIAIAIIFICSFKGKTMKK